MSEINSSINRVEEDWPVERLVPYDRNAKKHEPAQVKKIAESIRQHGWTTRIVVEEDGTIIAGHGRRLAALSLGLKTVPVAVLKGISKDQARALRLIDNKVQEGGYDTDLLSQELRELVMDLDVDMSKFFDDRDLNFAIDDLGEIDLDFLSDDIAVEVQEQTERTQAEIQSADEDSIQLVKVLGFSSVTAAQARVIRQFLAILEGETGLQGAEALVAFAREFCVEEA